MHFEFLPCRKVIIYFNRKKYDQARDLNPQSGGQKSIVLTITPWKLHTRLDKNFMNRQKVKMHVSYID